MKTIRTFAALCSFCFSTLAPARAELPAGLQRLATKFDAENAALAASSEMQLKPARDRYLEALATAQKTATAAAKTGDIAAIASEIEGTNLGTLTPEFPPDLPRTLSQDRRTFISVAANVARTVPPRQRELTTTYLKTLGTVEADALKARNTALAEAVAAEKTRIVAILEALGGGQKGRTVVTNGDFSQGAAGVWPPGWKKSSDDISVTDATVIAEGSEKFLRFRRLQALRRAELLPEKEIVIPARAKYVDFTVKIRGKGVVPGKSYDENPGVHVTVRDARGEEVSGKWAVIKQDSPWKKFSEHVDIPTTGKTLRVSVGPFGAAGVIDFDDIAVEFR